MSFQITILKVLAGHPEGRASLADLTRYVAVLTSSGADWSQRMKRLAARAPGLDIFTSGYVVRDDTGWRVTDAGRDFLRSIEAAAPAEAAPPAEPTSEPAIHEPAIGLTTPDLRPKVVQMVDFVRRQRAAA